MAASKPKKVEIKQTGSSIGGTSRQRDTLRALGLGKIGRSVQHKPEPSIIGMIRTVQHLVVVREVSE